MFVNIGRAQSEILEIQNADTVQRNIIWNTVGKHHSAVALIQDLL
jgi:hypothetical protein